MPFCNNFVDFERMWSALNYIFAATKHTRCWFINIIEFFSCNFLLRLNSGSRIVITIDPMQWFDNIWCIALKFAKARKILQMLKLSSTDLSKSSCKTLDKADTSWWFWRNCSRFLTWQHMFSIFAWYHLLHHKAILKNHW